MKFSVAWLKRYVNFNVDITTLSTQLTSVGLEVETIATVADDFTGVVVGEVISVIPHPNADRLRVCQVDVNQAELLTIVCGAPNVHTGMRAPVALIGAILKKGTAEEFKIKQSNLRSVASHGMLCAASELGLVDDAEGLYVLAKDAPLGADIREYLELNDVTFDLNLTPNRGDCASLLGVAREVSAYYHLPLTLPVIPEMPATIAHGQKVAVDEAKACPHYVGRVIQNIHREARTPSWMKERLRRSGIGSKGPLVDVTNYVMLELGQPMHAFDLEKLSGVLVVRYAKPGERLVLLDEREVNLSSDTLVIADQEKVLALAGVMGGLESAISASTQHIFLESAYFTPDSVAGKSREYGAYSDSSYRFERGVDPALQNLAIERATHLLLTIAGGDAGPLVEITAPLKQAHPILLSLTQLTKLLGITIEAARVADILTHLGMKLETVQNGFKVTPPSYRFDIKIEADLIEEIARMVGYDAIPASAPKVHLPLASVQPATVSKRIFADTLVARGYHEIVSYSFVSEALQTLLDPAVAPEKLSNPISSEMSVMRTTLWPGLIATLQYNLKRQQTQVRLFEMGLCFIPHEKTLLQSLKIGFLVNGLALPVQWGSSARAVDFYDVKADVEALLHLTHRRIRFAAATHPALHPSQSAAIFLDEEAVGLIGALHPSIAQALKLKNVFLCELDYELIKSRVPVVYKALSKYPSVERDLAIILSDQYTADDLLNVLKKVSGTELIDLRLFDVYQGDAIPAGHKSLAVRFTFQDAQQTLNDEAVDQMMKKIIETLKVELSAAIRA